MLVFACSAKSGSGRTVTAANIAYRRALDGLDACYVDLDEGSMTSAMLFQVQESVLQGEHHMHAYLTGRIAAPPSLDVWLTSERAGLRQRPRDAGRLHVVPAGGIYDQLATSRDMSHRLADLLLSLDEQFHLVVFDLAAGRSYALEAALASTVVPQLRRTVVRWLVFQRWTREHVVTTGDLVFGERGIVEAGRAFGHDPDELLRSLRIVRTAVADPGSPEHAALRPAQLAWIHEVDRDLNETASRLNIGRVRVLGTVPHDPVLQWREQLITDDEATLTGVANQETVEAYARLGRQLFEDAAWEGL